MGSWEKRTLKLPEHHGWRAKPGYKIFVMDRGAVRFDFPENWDVTPSKTSVKFRDKPAPDDNCILEVSYLRLPPIEWSGLPLSKLLKEIVARDERGVLSQGEVINVLRPDLELAWIEHRFMDPVERREAISRICLARGQGIQALITFACWPEHTEQFNPVWDEVLRSLQLGMWVEDPTKHLLH